MKINLTAAFNTSSLAKNKTSQTNKSNKKKKKKKKKKEKQ